jgi:hypothetical protein
MSEDRDVETQPAESGREVHEIDVYPDGIAVGGPGRDAGTVDQDGNVTRIDFTDDDNADPRDTTVNYHNDDGGGDDGGGDDSGGNDGGDDGGGDDDRGPRGGDE